jgi:PhnO protein
MNIFIRHAQPQDFDFIFRFISELEQEVFDVDLFRRVYEKNINNSDYAYYIAISDNSPVGCISFHSQYLLHHCGKVGEIQEFYVEPENRNKGIGKLLMQEIFSWALKNNIINVEVTSNKMRIENAMIYEHLGFQMTHNKFTMKLNDEL